MPALKIAMHMKTKTLHTAHIESLHVKPEKVLHLRGQRRCVDVVQRLTLLLQPFDGPVDDLVVNVSDVHHL